MPRDSSPTGELVGADQGDAAQREDGEAEEQAEQPRVPDVEQVDPRAEREGEERDQHTGGTTEPFAHVRVQGAQDRPDEERDQGAHQRLPRVKDPKNGPAFGKIVWISAPMSSGTIIICRALSRGCV
jgi:hypothetical protein